MTSFEILKEISAENNGLILSSEALKNGISRATLYQLNKTEKITRVAVGQYVLSDNINDEMYSLCMRSDLIVFSHESALFLNGISERTPFEHTITIPSTKTLSRSLSKECKIYYIKDNLYSMGRTQLVTPMRNKVWAYDMERTICDIVRCHSRISEETFISSLKQYATNTNKNLSKLGFYAEKMGILKKVRYYLEVLL